MFATLWKKIASLIRIGTQAEPREIEAFMAQAKTLADIEHLQRELERDSTYTHMLSGW